MNLFVPYYKLTEQPFGVTPDPRFLYLTPTHREAIASVMYGVMENRGFSALIAPPGMGKTTLLFELLQRLGDSVRTVFLFQFQPSPEGLLRNLLSELGVSDEGLSFEGMQERLNQLILEESKKGRRIVVVVDEAQNFREPVLEVLRMLSNFETSQAKLIHIILSGQPQLAEMLFSPAIEQLRQRISIMAALRPLSTEETKEYIEHRLRLAGHSGRRPLFTNTACERIAEYSRGIPRNINNLCFNAMSLGCALRRGEIDQRLVDEVFRDLNLEVDRELSPAKTLNANAADGLNRFVPVSTPAVWPAVAPAATGKGWSFAAGALSVAAVLCVGAVFAKQYALSEGSTSLSLRTPAPPVPQVEITSPSPAPEAEGASDISDRTAPAPPELNAEPVSTPIAPRAKPQQRRKIDVTEHVPVKLVRPAERQSLLDLCRKNLSTCDVNALSEIRRLNPWLHDATQLERGQPVLLPLEGPSKKGFPSGVKTNSGENR